MVINGTEAQQNFPTNNNLYILFIILHQPYHFTCSEMEASYSEDILEGSRYEQEDIGSCGQRVNKILVFVFVLVLEVVKMPVYLLGFFMFNNGSSETLSYISRLYGVPIPEIAAANKDIVRDADQVFEGQHLSIPSAVVGCAQLFHSGKDTEHQSRKATSSLGFNIREWNQILTLPLSSLSPIAKTTGSFLVLLLLVAFCIRCILGALQSRVERNMRHQHRSNSKRWRAVLSDLTDPNPLDAESGPDSEPFLEDHENLHFEDADHAYSKLENDYQKFLLECGMSNWGHFRGGSPD